MNMTTWLWILIKIDNIHWIHIVLSVVNINPPITLSSPYLWALVWFINFKKILRKILTTPTLTQFWPFCTHLTWLMQSKKLPYWDPSRCFPALTFNFLPFCLLSETLHMFWLLCAPITCVKNLFNTASSPLMHSKAQKPGTHSSTCGKKSSSKH
jgi:hypothetical protein